MGNYLVTGGAGFIGSNITAALVARGDAVRVVDNLSTGRRENLAPWLDQIDFVKGDLRDPEICRQVVRDMDYILHQAAVPSVPRSVADPLLCHASNVTATLNLLIAARDAGVRRFVFAGSSSAYGNQTVAIKTEELAPGPLSPYAAAKVASEHYLQAFSTCYGLETVTLRYFNVFGPRQDPDSPYSAVIPNFIRSLSRGEVPTIHGDGTQARDFTYVENNVRANLLAATADIPARGEIYNIACGVPVTVLQLFEAIRQRMHSSCEPIFAAARVGDVHTSTASIERARQALGYGVAVPFEEGLDRTVAWYCQALQGG
jgi:nucleoside-diphosphate-sugar epimerase